MRSIHAVVIGSPAMREVCCRDCAEKRQKRALLLATARSGPRSFTGSWPNLLLPPAGDHCDLWREATGAGGIGQASGTSRPNVARKAFPAAKQARSFHGSAHTISIDSTRHGATPMMLTDEQLHRLDEDGFLVLHDVFTPEEVDLLRAEVPGMVAERCAENPREAGRESVRNILSLHRRNELYGRLVRHPRMLEAARQILGEEVYAQQVKINLKTGFDGGGFEWHTDFATHHNRDGVPKPLALNFHIHLDDVTEFNGPLMFVPGSHKREIPLERSVDGEKWELWTVPRDGVTRLVNELGMVSAKGPRGTLLIFGDNLL
ncbi:MAG: hypothetical protein EOO21_02165, partial [Comamonadaceae bacterium]